MRGAGARRGKARSGLTVSLIQGGKRWETAQPSDAPPKTSCKVKEEGGSKEQNNKASPASL